MIIIKNKKKVFSTFLGLRFTVLRRGRAADPLEYYLYREFGNDRELYTPRGLQYRARSPEFSINDKLTKRTIYSHFRFRWLAKEEYEIVSAESTCKISLTVASYLFVWVEGGGGGQIGFKQNWCVGFEVAAWTAGVRHNMSIFGIEPTAARRVDVSYGVEISCKIHTLSLQQRAQFTFNSWAAGWSLL